MLAREIIFYQIAINNRAQVDVNILNISDNEQLQLISKQVGML